MIAAAIKHEFATQSCVVHSAALKSRNVMKKGAESSSGSAGPFYVDLLFLFRVRSKRSQQKFLVLAHFV